MRDVNHALDRLREISGIAKLEMGSNGQAELIFGEKTSVYLIKVNEDVLELASFLDLPGFEGEAGLKALLHANHLGDATGASRIALDPQHDVPLLCRRVEVALFDDRSLEQALLDFVKFAAFWQSPDARSLLQASAPTPKPQEGLRDDASFVIRP